MSEELTDYDRRNTEERKVAFGKAIADLCNQWSMSINRSYLPICALREGMMIVASDMTDFDGDVSFDEREVVAEE